MRERKRGVEGGRGVGGGRSIEKEREGDEKEKVGKQSQELQ